MGVAGVVCASDWVGIISGDEEYSPFFSLSHQEPLLLRELGQ